MSSRYPVDSVRPEVTDPTSTGPYRPDRSPPERNPVDLGEFLRPERPVHRGDVLLDLLRRGRSGDHARDLGAAGEPAEGEFEHGMSLGLAEIAELLDDRPIRVGHVPIGQALDQGQPGELR